MYIFPGTFAECIAHCHLVLLKVLVAVYNEAYRAITGNAKNEYLALFSQKTMRFARAPAKDAYIPPFNLVKLVLTPLQWFLSKRQWHGLHRCIMTVIYSPALLIIAFLESRQSHRGICNWVRVKVGDQKVGVETSFKGAHKLTCFHSFKSGRNTLTKWTSRPTDGASSSRRRSRM